MAKGIKWKVCMYVQVAKRKRMRRLGGGRCWKAVENSHWPWRVREGGWCQLSVLTKEMNVSSMQRWKHRHNIQIAFCYL